ncbi:putative disease resistance RPP13-like protein 3 [Carex rostrata]
MAEAIIVNIVVDKLANIIAKEIQFLGGVGEKVKKAQRELTRIQSCLKDADSKRKLDERVQNWLNELRNVAYRIEDAIDMFFIKVECNKNNTCLQKLKNKPREVYFLHKLGTKLDSIQNELEEISKSRLNYGITALQDIAVGDPVILPVRRTTYSEVDETEVVGLDADRDKILKLLHPEETPRRAVITIVGTGGIGKTTLAHIIYKRDKSNTIFLFVCISSAKAKFEYHIMLSVSQQFNLTELLKKMLRQLIDDVPNELDVEGLMSELKKKLSSRRYLIILDDVWQVDVWNHLKNALPDDKNGSRVLITSRSIDVAKSADPIMAPCELNLLDDQKSIDLLLKKALPNQEPSEELASDLLKLANELSKKCEGLPLALVVLGGILSTKDRNYHAWERVFRTMDWHSKGKECMDVLAMSYEDMPYYLKACFLYLALFPEDYQISARRLIRMWVAEGFIPQEERITMEEIAEDYLYELFQRSMIQVSSRHVNGSIKCFQVHDLLRDLAMHKAREENFVMVFSEESDSKKPNKEIRRASFHSLKYGDDNFHLRNNLLYLEYARSLLLFGEYGWSPIPANFRKFRLLKVLVLEGVENHDVDLVRGLEKLVHLKYLGLRGCHIPISKCSFHCMKALETLDMREILIYGDGEVPDGIWSIDTLRHVRCDSDNPFKLPKTTAELKNIQTLQRVYFNKKMPLLSSLCKLDLVIEEDGDPIAFTSNLFATLPSLVSLSIHSWYDSLTMEVVYPKALPNYQHLQSLYLDGEWSENVTLDASLFPPHLLKLTLEWSRFGQNPMPELGKLKSLKKLCLECEVLSIDLYYNSGPIFCPAGFPVLQYLKLGGNSMKSLTVAEGTMPNLKYLNVYDHDIMFHLPPELQHIDELYENLIVVFLLTG